MQDDTKKQPEPRGFGEHVRVLAGEYAHEQGWGLNEAERTHESDTPQDSDGGTNYAYGARDFGDEPVNADITEREPVGNASPAHPQAADPASSQPSQPTPDPQAPKPAASNSGTPEPQPAPAKSQGDPLGDVI